MIKGEFIVKNIVITVEVNNYWLEEQQKEGNAGPGPGSRVTAQGSDLSAQLGGRGWGGLQLVWVGLLGEPLLGSGPLTS